jgi:[acyl-carrier-protein] S-malonyltransferase
MRIIPEKTTFLFPGQGSQVVGMGKDLAKQFSACNDLFMEADEILGFSLSNVMWEGPIEKLNDTIYTQPALFVHSMAALRLLQMQFPIIKPAYLAGHSLGEISAIVSAGVVSFENGLRLVRRRGELMKRAGEISPGGMAAVLGLDVNILDEICNQVSDEVDIVQVANDNCPGQIVISGSKVAIQKVVEPAKAQGARKVIPLAVSIAAHSKLMSSAIIDFEMAIENLDEFKIAEVDIISNVNASPMNTTQEIKKDLLEQLISRVRWTESIQFLIKQGVSTFIELGSGNVLTGLLKRIDDTSQGFAFGTLENLSMLQQEMDVSSGK